MLLEPGTRSEVSFDPIVEEWFARRFGSPTAPQVGGWPHINEGRDVLISAPTGSGKTLAAFMVAIDRLLREARNGLTDNTHVVYVSPLKALVNDVHLNLQLPLAEIRALASEHDVELAPITVALRTGDTPVKDRARMVGRPPHILVTTPESLFILLTAARSREIFRTVSTVIVDEIHAMIANKRGPHLALSLARLDKLAEETAGRRPQRIGLSATVKPVEEVARFLSPQASIVNIGHRREMDLAVEVPQDELGPVASNEAWADIYDRLTTHVREHRTTLIFVSTRRLAERVSHHLAERLGEGSVMPHHGSLARHIRLDTEQRLKRGELRAVVATASLELGIDIGSVDLVVQIGSPRSIAVALQRIGRSGHWVGARPKGILFASTRDELVESAAVVKAIRTGAMDKLEPVRNARDILAQQLVAECAAQEWDEDALFELVRSTAAYETLTRAEFDDVVVMLADGISTSRGRAGALLHRDRVNGRVRGRRGARIAAITSGGAIADTTTYSVVADPDDTPIGTIDEDFAIESMAGDIFLLGMQSWRIRRVEPGRVRVFDAHGAPPSIPFWNGEAPGRTLELSQEVGRLRERIAQVIDDEGAAAAADYLVRECGLDRLGAEQVVGYIQDGRAILGAVPTCARVVAERFFDEAGGMQLVVHAPFGARINRAWGLALRKRFCRTFNLELQAAATDNGIVISLSEQHAFPLATIFGFLKEQSVEDVLTQAMLPSPMFAARWRWNGQRFLALQRFLGGRRVPANIQRMRADDLLAAVFPDRAACPENLGGEEVRIPDHPLVNETVDDCLHEAMDLDGLKAVLRGISDGSVATVAIDTAEPSKFSHEILNANPFAFLDDAPLEERRARAVQLRSTTRIDVSDGVGVLDVAAIAAVAEQVWPLVRDAHELHDALLTLVVVPPQPQWREWFDELRAAGRASELTVDTRWLWTPTEKRDVAERARNGDPDAVDEIVKGWMESTGPTTATALADRLALSASAIEDSFGRLEMHGQVFRGSFTPGLDSKDEWCNRRVLARIHRTMLATLRREIEPVSAAVHERFLDVWQHLAAGTQLHGVAGTLAAIKQLQGLEFPAASWESDVLQRRIARYNRDYLDKLCASGEVMWGRLSPHPAFEATATPRRRRVRPTRVAPVAIFLREDAAWLFHAPHRDGAALSATARDVRVAIERRGASFFIDIVRATGRLPSEVEDGLWELVAAGIVTADGFDNLRALVDPRRRLATRRHERGRPRNAPGRWALLEQENPGRDVAAFARQLLARWGVVFRDIVLRESFAPPWRDLLVELRRMELQGVIRGGRFVSTYVGEQFCLPEALESLRQLRPRD
ncbi:MAG TPA: DEAD/DEAH box helicase [Candidatus Eremiobacteraceae bacterium]|nr:DEAD/DEAH box helicase [Candidatus Eremiobacteraceae bacterium]